MAMAILAISTVSSLKVSEAGKKIPHSDFMKAKHNQKTKPEPKARQSVYLYDGPNLSGNYLYLDGYSPVLYDQGFDNIATSTYLNGIWLFYDQEFYNQNYPNGAAAWAWGEDFPYNLDEANFDNLASSVRYSGAPDDYRADVLQIYQYEYFGGDEQYFYDDSPQTNFNFGQSIVITGCNAWTVYDLENYQGNSACFYPLDSNFCYPGFYQYFLPEVSYLTDRVRSVRRGCFSKNVLNAHPLEQGEIMTREKFERNL